MSAMSTSISEVSSGFRRELAGAVASKTARRGDVIITTKGNSTGRTSYVGQGVPPFVYSPHLSYWRSLDTQTILPRFLRYWSRSRQFRDQLAGMAASTDMAPYLSLVDQRRLRIVLPPVKEQRAIAGILGTLDDKIELNRRMSETLEAIARALFVSWFVDFDPVHAKALGRDPGLPKHLAELFPNAFEDSESEEMPKGWSKRGLDVWATALSGGTPSRDKPALWNGTIPWISPKVMTAIHADEADAHVTEDALANGTRLAPSGSTLVMVRGMGLHEKVRVSQARRDVAFNQDVKALVPTRIEPTLLLFGLLQAQAALLGKVESSGHGTGKLSTDVLLAHPVTMPPPEIQRGLTPVFDAINERFCSLRGLSRTHAALRDTLLPKLTSGELRVKDAERIVAGHV